MFLVVLVEPNYTHCYYRYKRKLKAAHAMAFGKYFRPISQLIPVSPSIFYFPTQT